MDQIHTKLHTNERYNSDDFFLEFKTKKISGLNRINILLGKNGCGKSILLREIEINYRSKKLIQYITPERGGQLEYDATIEANVSNSPDYLAGQRSQNQAALYRQQSFTLLRQFEVLILRKIEVEKRDIPEYTFNKNFLKLINTLLECIEIRRKENGGNFEIVGKDTNEKIPPTKLSSGESEIISLGIECLVFAEKTQVHNDSILLMDEPDVHLHPDLQYKFIKFLVKLAADYQFNVLIATHSTAILGAVSELNQARVCFMKKGQTELKFQNVSETHKKILPIFGSHPLSNVFNQNPILLLEGEDDVRIWQQAIRSSNGTLKLYPCAVDSVNKLSEFEDLSAEILEAVYDHSIGYSLRDGDDKIDIPLADHPKSVIKRFRLNCYSAENLLLTDEVLEYLKTDWITLKEKILKWIENNPEHQHLSDMKDFATVFNRQKYSLKQIRNDLMGIIGSNKPWEVAVGGVLGGITSIETKDFREGKICNFLSEELVNSVFLIKKD